ncbi:group I intron endonuclease [Polaribacter sp. KT25b]|nr:group I intron endonuclease [Polaribacter sp. KT25b]
MKETMENQNNSFIIYKAENTQNGYVYVGATKKSVECRQKDHFKKSKKGKSYTFQNAIATYGADAFKWEEIDTAITTNELAKKEKEYILEYNSKEQGYNSDSGGGIQKTVYQYDILRGVLVNKYSNLTDASATIGLNKQNLSKVCLSVNKASKGFYWTYDYVERFIPLEDKRKKKVHQYNIQGEFINEFESVSEASKQTRINKSCIAKVCRGERKSSGGYLWKFN